MLRYDIAGLAERLGRKITQFNPGDDVFGDLYEGLWGGFTEFVCAREKELSIKPAVMTYDGVVATPQAGILALQGALR